MGQPKTTGTAEGAYVVFCSASRGLAVSTSFFVLFTSVVRLLCVVFFADVDQDLATVSVAVVRRLSTWQLNNPPRSIRAGVACLKQVEEWILNSTWLSSRKEAWRRSDSGPEGASNASRHKCRPNLEEKGETKTVAVFPGP